MLKMSYFLSQNMENFYEWFYFFWLILEKSTWKFNFFFYYLSFFSSQSLQRRHLKIQVLSEVNNFVKNTWKFEVFFSFFLLPLLPPKLELRNSSFCQSPTLKKALEKFKFFFFLPFFFLFFFYLFSPQA